MSKSPFITIITAALNSEATIKKTLESVRNQTFQDFEHIVIDGGSRDETLEILKKYDNTYNLTWISEPDNGIADAMNKGIDLATGDYILFLHSDDYLVNSSVLKRASEYLADRFDIFFCNRSRLSVHS